MAALDRVVALVTGGSSGIGLATARRLVTEGARVAVADLADPPAGVAEMVLHEDVAESSAWPRIVEQVTARMGGIDIAHLNAGVTTGEGDVTAVTDEQWRRVMRVNVDQVFFGVRALAAHMADRGGGVIVCTASLAGLTGFVNDPVYTASKHAVVGMVRGAAPALAERRVRINAVCPGIVETPLIAEGLAALQQAGFPLLQPEEVAEAVIRSITGGGTGECWFIQPGRESQPFTFRNVPGPRVPGTEGMLPPVH